MKKTRFPAALLLAVCLSLLLSLGAAAAGASYTLTLRNTGATSHSFDVYQIFTGDLSVNDGGQRVLSNIVWGSGVTAQGQSDLGDAAAKADALRTEAEARSFAYALVAGGYLTDAVTQVVPAGGTQTVPGLTAGYYLIKDREGTQDLENGAYTAYLLAVVGDVTASSKLSTPTVEKKVRDVNDTLDADPAALPWQDAADYDVGDAVPFQLAGTLPDNFADYETYFYRFTDELSAGLTYREDARVSVETADREVDVTDQVSVSCTASASGSTLTITIPDLKALSGVTLSPGCRVLVRYTALLNESAVPGAPGNPNTVFLTYSNNPNPGGTGTGVTPRDKTVVFTYQLTVSKTDETGGALAGAGFTLYKKDSRGDWQTVREYAAGERTSFVFTGLDDGDYKLAESAVPEGFNRMEDLVFTLSAEHDTLSADPALLSLCGAVTDGETILLSGTLEAGVSLSAGAVSTTVVNKAGALLPSTGGVGTTVFYIVGSVLAVGAAVLLITRRRMRAED